jgi:hypothetical protein
MSSISHARLQKNFSNNIVNNNITELEVQEAQKAWGAALIKISSDYEKGGINKATETANEVLDTAYGYNMGTVLFKPTLAYGEQTFRTTKEGALSYFVGNNKKFAQDNGFALLGWKKYEFKNAGVYINGDMAITMGHVILTDKAGKVTTVDKTWGFKKDAQGKLRIVLHHSSIPFSPAPKVAAN